MSAKTNPGASSEKSDARAYMREAQSWETSRVLELQSSRRAAWWVAIGAGVLAIASVVALAALTPLKETKPYVIRVDNSTGVVDVAQSMPDGKTNYEEAVNKYFTQWYVRYREGYSRDIAEEYYRNVGLMSGQNEQQRYAAWFGPKNPESPLNVYGQHARVKINIKSTSFISPTVALIRYSREIERANDKPEVSHWVATVAFGYLKSSMTEKDREINPLGFQVSEYRNDPETQQPGAAVNAAPVATPAAPAASGVTLFPTAQ